MRIYKYLLDTYNLNPDESIFIDDSVANINAANELGIHGIVYTDIEIEHRKIDTIRIIMKIIAQVMLLLVQILLNFMVTYLGKIMSKPRCYIITN